MHERPDSNTLTFVCDKCEASYSFYGDEGSPVADTAKCISMVHKIGWTSKKLPGYAWENYCLKCSGLSEDEKRPTPMARNKP